MFPYDAVCLEQPTSQSIANVTPIPGRCNGVSSTDLNCCSKNNQCDIGEGDCFHDFDCAGDLVCGDANCDEGALVNCCEGILILSHIHYL